MRKLLLYSLLVAFVAAITSKWYLSFALRINYYIVVLILWSCAALPYLTRRKIPIPGGIQVLVCFRFALLGSMLLTLPSVLASSEPASMEMFLKGFVTESINSLFIVMILLFVMTLEADERSTIINLYLGAIGVCLIYNLIQFVGAYRYGMDVDAILSDLIPKSARDVAPSIERGRYGLASAGGGVFFRLNGLAEDPNLNGVTILIAVPVMFWRGMRRNRIWLGLLALLSIGVILLTVSNTAIPITLLVLVMLTLKYWKKAWRLVLIVTGTVAALALFLVIERSDVLEEIGNFRLSSDGTSSEHLRIGREALALWSAHPLGVGVNNFGLLSPDISTHNSYIQVLTEQGPVGLLVTLSWVAYCLWVCYTARTRLGYAVLLSVGALALASLGHDLLFRFELQSVAYLLVALVILARHDQLGAVLAQTRHAGEGDRRPQDMADPKDARGALVAE